MTAWRYHFYVSVFSGFLDSLRYISKHTGIMSNPENFQREAQTRIHDHFLNTPIDQLTLGKVASLAAVPKQQPRSQAPSSVPQSPRVPHSPRVPQSPRVITPIGTPRVVTPAPGSRHASVPSTPKGCTPIPTPTSSPPKTPVAGRRSKKRDSMRSIESRSRSNSPDAAEVKNKKRSSYRYL